MCAGRFGFHRLHRQIEPRVDELRASSAAFDALWRNNDIQAYGEGRKHLRHPASGMLVLDYSSFIVDGRPDLSRVVYSPVSAGDAARIKALIEALPAAAQ